MKILGYEISRAAIGETRSKYIGFLSNILPINADRWSKGNYLKAAEVSLYVNKAINRRAEKVSEIEFQLKRPNGDLIESDPVLDLLMKPNKVFTGRQFWQLWQKYYDIFGEAYIWLEREPTFGGVPKVSGMHLPRPDTMTPVYDKEGSGEIIKYEQYAGSSKKEYEPDSIIYTFNPDPANQLRGQSLLRAGINAIKLETQLAEYHSRVLENGGEVGGVFKFKTGPLSKDQLSDIKDKYQKEYGSARKAGLPLFLGGDADYVKTGLTPSELSFLDAKKMVIDDIVVMTGVPRALLGVASDETYANADASIRIFLRETIRPLLVILTTALDERLFPDDRKLDFVDPTPENIEDKLSETKSGMENSYMTINEARERHGLDPVPEGDQILVPINRIPLAADTGGEKKIKASDKVAHPLSDEKIRRMWAKVQVKRLDRRTEVFRKVVVRYFNDQRDRLIESIGGEKAYTKDLLDEAMNIDLEVQIAKDKFGPVLEELLIEAGEDAAELIGSGDFQVTAAVGEHLDTRSDLFTQSINTTTFNKLKKEFADSFAEGESRPQLVKRIRDTYGEITKGRAETIARTEVHEVTQFATLETYGQAGLTTKIWVWAPGVQGGVREAHFAIDGQERPINSAFSNGLIYPGSGPAAETVNCQCTI